MRKPFTADFPITQNFNDPRYRANYLKFGLLGHNGIDYGLPTGTPVLAPHSGKIIEATLDPSYGNYVKIENEVEGSVLAHLKSISVKVDEIVSEGEVIGLSDNTGNSTGSHLHWGYYRIPRNRDNGLNGYIDQTDWLNLKLPQLVITDQTKIPQIGNKEVQQIRSEMEAKDREIGSLTLSMDGLNAKITQLEKDLEYSTTHPSNPPQIAFSKPIAQFLFDLAKFVEGKV